VGLGDPIARGRDADVDRLDGGRVLRLSVVRTNDQVLGFWHRMG